ncbi:putative transcriptional regulatory protein [Neolecta irregularis DAH-3]|uniref:Putative transcriptional regulatory protein n=1 Tax=Neolecta irregularis (strain DAH-3) TaxID=1198029 RepID=A0A1U7LMB1_NEOID|nr:putative transcriptional regulatory protein [Neolecta irregularis DAH-3]|eukprot:OLL23682.1 putative transcriptional regulatory protein [Neolecta irregularis DAH-3]
MVNSPVKIYGASQTRQTKKGPSLAKETVARDSANAQPLDLTGFVSVYSHLVTHPFDRGRLVLLRILKVERSEESFVVIKTFDLLTIDLQSFLDSSDNMATLIPPNPYLRRHRAVHSCQRCRQRKIKCDRTFPCDPCGKRRVECIYTDLSVVVQDNEQLAVKLARAEEKLARLGESLDDNATPRSISPSETEELCEFFGRMDVQNGNQRYRGDIIFPRVGPAVIRQDRNVVGDMHPPLFANHLNSSPATRRVLPIATFSDMILRFLPPQDLSDALISRYLRVDVFCHFYLPPNFIEEYKAFWTGQYVEPFFVALLFGVLSATLQVYDNGNPIITTLSAIIGIPLCDYRVNLCNAAENCLRMGDYLEHFDLRAVQALVVNSMNFDLLTPSKSYVNAGILVTMAHSLGLHRDPSYWEFPPLECEHRRRLWTSILIIDAMSSWNQSLPLHMDLDEFDTQPPTYDPKYDGVSVLDHSRFEFAKSIGHMMFLYATVHQTVSSRRRATQAKIMRLDSQIRDFGHNIPHSVLVNESEADPAILWRNLTVEAAIARLELFLHLPFINRSTDSKMLAKQAAVRSMKSIIIACGPRAAEFLRWHWFGFSWMTKNALIATVISCLHLTAENSKDEETWRVVDKAYQILRTGKAREFLGEEASVCEVIQKLRFERKLNKDVLEILYGTGWFWVRGFADVGEMLGDL